MTGDTSTDQPAIGSRSSSVRTSPTSAPASIRLPSAMSPAIPAKQWNQATVVMPERLPRPSCRGDDPEDRTRRAEAVVDPDHGDAGRARREHGQQGGDTFEGGAV